MRFLRDFALVVCCAALIVFGYAIALAQWGGSTSIMEEQAFVLIVKSLLVHLLRKQAIVG